METKQIIKIIIITIILFIEIKSELTEETGGGFQGAGFVWQQTGVLNTTLNVSGFGRSLAMEEDVVIIGAPMTYVGVLPSAGMAFIFRSDGYNWTNEANLTASDPSLISFFGQSVAIYGNMSVVGAYLADNGSTISQGKAYVYKRNDSGWFEFKKLLAEDGEENDFFGGSVAINNEYIIVSAFGAAVNGSENQGKVYVYTYDETNVTHLVNFSSSDGKANDTFGYSLSLSNNILVVGSMADVNNNTNQGKVYVFEENSSVWNETCIINSIDGEAYDNFGSSVAILDEVIAIGAPNKTIGNQTQQGRVYVYRKNGSNWNSSEIFTAADGNEGDCFGFSVGVSVDSVIVGANRAEADGSSSKGKGYIYQNKTTYWIEEAILISTDGSGGEHFGSSVAIHENSSIIGADMSSYNNSYPMNGQAFVFKGSAKPPEPQSLNCTSMPYAWFTCNWTSVLNLTTYQIKYSNVWVDIPPNLYVNDSGIMEANFTHNNFTDILGNVNYTIYVRVCNDTNHFCSDPSLPSNITTMIGIVENFTLSSSNDSISVSWDFPNVSLFNNTPVISHYVLSYNNTSSSVNISLNSSTTSYDIYNLSCFTMYNISIWACRTLACEGEDQGEIQLGNISTSFNRVYSFWCNVYNYLTIECYWYAPLPQTVLPTFYNFTYNSTPHNDSANFHINNTETNYTQYNFTSQYQDEDYQFYISACDQFGYCGDEDYDYAYTGIIPQNSAFKFLIFNNIFFFLNFFLFLF
ncbi:hypothetical protein M0811_08785 [Anaeramoeba ignava]|uniref:Fibronectin type-III domain-containing protein n=1 Tax=Anaeramoeba ignava TaxID=1746090 RepID=A0A9Q0RAR5_ANAIG|nr:hypothetical protein M0811_08785 [Anaeramoeba ignava]|eukprot:Anaeramoba_ignava/a482379_121.p1 GENE.a482379_121~~a482379_121.p1  ORF type:complete len:746 (+),score=167.07 a482379_121:1188-3425(+)